MAEILLIDRLAVRGHMCISRFNIMTLSDSENSFCRPKSTVACQAAAALNKDFKPVALQNRVSPITEDVFHDGFWNELDIVVNALDNVTARLYVDSRCVYFSKPLLESGTLGPKCNTQVIVPYLTENYGEHQLPKATSAESMGNYLQSDACILVLDHSRVRMNALCRSFKRPT